MEEGVLLSLRPYQRSALVFMCREEVAAGGVARHFWARVPCVDDGAQGGGTGSRRGGPGAGAPMSLGIATNRPFPRGTFPLHILCTAVRYHLTYPISSFHALSYPIHVLSYRPGLLLQPLQGGAHIQ